jgi:MSHA biogenesis protein MshO
MILVPAFDSYFASQRRAQMAEVADTALRRMTRDIRLALPNSPRVDATNSFLEILMTKNGGRYRALNDSLVATTENPLDFSATDSVFDTLGSLPTGVDQTVAANDYIVIHNLGISGANAYDIAAANRNIAQVSALGAGALANEDRITLAVATQFPLESPGRRFFVVSGPVTYACVGGSLLRWSAYAIQLRGGLPPTTRPGGATEAVLAENVSACNLSYTTLPQVSRGLVGVRLAITRGNETVTLYYEAHVNNVP